MCRRWICRSSWGRRLTDFTPVRRQLCQPARSVLCGIGNDCKTLAMDLPAAGRLGRHGRRSGSVRYPTTLRHQPGRHRHRAQRLQRAPTVAAPFIDSKGKLASLGVTEAESASLADDGMIAWQRVAGYWRDSGTLASMGAARARPAVPPSTAAATPPVIAAHSWSTTLGRPPSFRG